LKRHAHNKPCITSDNRPQFIARSFKEFVRPTGMTHVRTSLSCPQSSGVMERADCALREARDGQDLPNRLEAGRVLNRMIHSQVL
jgi:hypothetical protein